ncbi:MAG: hypothetical protein BWY28_01943 [bacterium ADurb.Bin236]|nr:MAG: hypothetical protein BWY28_01943 [bacterium ADurb.Bin236]HPN96085.1 hypothetical protein [bacterium]
MPEPGDPDFFEFLALNNMLMYMAETEDEDMGAPRSRTEKPPIAADPSIGGCVLFAAAAVILLIIIIAAF